MNLISWSARRSRSVGLSCKRSREFAADPPVVDSINIQRGTNYAKVKYSVADSALIPSRGSRKQRERKSTHTYIHTHTYTYRGKEKALGIWISKLRPSATVSESFGTIKTALICKCAHTHWHICTREHTQIHIVSYSIWFRFAQINLLKISVNFCNIL